MLKRVRYLSVPLIVLVSFGAQLTQGSAGASLRPSLTAATPSSSFISSGPSFPWSGVAQHNGKFTSIGMHFVVPRVSAYCGRKSNAAIWVGLGGDSVFPFAQNGISISPQGDGAWYEVFDSRGKTIVRGVPMFRADGVAVQPKAGDVMVVSLMFTLDHQTLTFRWQNTTQHTNAYKVIRGAQKYYNGFSAEWIVELNDSSPNLARFSPISIYDAWASRSGVRVPAISGRFVSVYTLKRPRLGAKYMDSVALVSSSAISVKWRRCY